MNIKQTFTVLIGANNHFLSMTISVPKCRYLKLYVCMLSTVHNLQY